MTIAAGQPALAEDINAALAALMPLAGGTLTGPLTLPANPTTALQAATKQYVDAGVAGVTGVYLPLAGGALTGALMLAANATANLQPATLQQLNSTVANYLPLAGGTLTGALTLSANPTAAFNAATKQYVDTQIGTSLGGYLLLSGGTMLGMLTLSAPPTTTLQAANKGYVDSATSTLYPASNPAGYQTAAQVASNLNSYLPLGGGTLTGPLTLAANPTTNLQAATKQYVDNATGSSGNYLPITGGTVTGPLTVTAPLSATQTLGLSTASGALFMAGDTVAANANPLIYSYVTGAAAGALGALGFNYYYTTAGAQARVNTSRNGWQFYHDTRAVVDATLNLRLMSSTGTQTLATTWDTTGGLNGVIGSTTPAAGTFTTVASTNGVFKSGAAGVGLSLQSFSGVGLLTISNTGNGVFLAGMDNTVIGATTPAAGTFTQTVITNPVGQTLPAPYAWRAIGIQSDGSVGATMELIEGGSGGSAALLFRRCTGTPSIPAGVGNAVPLGDINFGGYDGTAWQNRTAIIRAQTAVTWANGSAYDTNLMFYVTAGTALTNVATITGTGLNNTVIGATTPAAGTFTSVKTGSTTGPTWTTGAGAPSSTQPVGSIYSNTSGAAGARLYVSAGGGTWTAVAGV